MVTARGTRERRGELLWWAPASIVTVCVVVELLPVVFGRGNDAVWDWGWIYITMRFVALPFACLAGFASGIVLAIVAMRRGDVPRVVSSLALAVVSTAYLVGVYVDPLPWLRWMWE